MGLAITAHAFPDHHAYADGELGFPGADAVVMTETDAVRCHGFAAATWWAMAVDAVPDAGLAALILRRLEVTVNRQQQ